MIENEERRFLHDLSGPLGTALFLQDLIVDGLVDRGDVDARERTQAVQVLESLRRMRTMIENRRATLIAQSTPSRE